MSTVLEIESALQALPDEERWDLLSRFERDLWSEWDAEIAADQKEGGLAHLIAEARADVTAGRIRPLHEVLRHP